MSTDGLERMMRLLSVQVLSAADLRRHLGTSQPTVSRLIGQAGKRVLRLGRGRATRYVAARDVFGAGMSVPLFTVDETGIVRQAATLRAIATGGYLVDAPGAPFWLRGEAGKGRFNALPYFLYDLRPSGFLGRQLARALAAEWGFPLDPRLWDDHHIGEYLLRRGDDLPGNLLVGDAAARRVNERPLKLIAHRETEYPDLARQALSDGPPGSSAAGEQPKVAICHRDAGHVIVKFSPAGKSAGARRWCDLLRAEAHAVRLLNEVGICAPDTALFALADRTYLESRRFDRLGFRGRRPAVSLGMVDAEFGGEGHGWTRMAMRLHQRGLLAQRDLDRIAWLEVFGTWIGNTDMHPGNLSLTPSGSVFELLPVYDMLPMALAPVGGELPAVTLYPPIQSDANCRVWDSAHNAAVAYWSGLAGDRKLSASFRRIAGAQARRCRASGR